MQTQRIMGLKNLLASGTLLFSLAAPVSAMTPITTVYGDFGGSLWSASAGSTNPNIIDDSNHLLGFVTSDGTFSTGVNDALLTSSGITYNAQNFTAFPTSNTELIGAGSFLVGIPTNWQGVPRTSGTSTDIADLAFYLTDGSQGLNLSTTLYNINTQNLVSVQPGYETLTYNANINSPSTIADGIPDIIVSQMGDVGSLDRFHFVDSTGNMVGTQVSVNFRLVNPVFSHNNTLYSTTTGNYVTTAISKRARLLTFDVDDFGVNISNYSDVAGFVHTLSGQSDIAFTAYNRTGVQINAVDIAVDISISSLTCPIEAGHTGQLSISLTNTSAISATDIPIEVPLPTNINFLSHTASFSSGTSTGTVSYDPPTGRLTLQSLSAGDRAQIIINFEVGGTLATTENFSATLLTRHFLQDDSNAANNSDTAPLSSLCPATGSLTTRPVPVMPVFAQLLIVLMITSAGLLRLSYLRAQTPNRPG
ncbi:MAG: hypothetical protein ACK5ME_07395 [Parahaliea sp.]